MEPREHEQIPEEIETPIDLEEPEPEHDPEFESGLDILEHKELSGSHKWSPVVIMGGREPSLLALDRSFVCLNGDAARHSLALVASNDDSVVLPRIILGTTKRPHRRGRRGPSRSRK